ncbi:tetratricopeptide repeat protein 26 [Kipferlia bialata]|uniref:Tetratricopeptide repeat protein 26 n=1 Tax=Kipferlia bialata TaxID=797122 RepID=A0A9K3DBN4_9EUKA|nr:tetratricopeptide repeat protein 26 [Kipferlia bialata]|eukprot:g13925.t1
MMHSRRSMVAPTRPDRVKAAEQPPSLQEFLENRDFQGAVTYLRFLQRTEGAERSQFTPERLNQWLGYCEFHLGEHEKAKEIYMSLFEADPSDTMYPLFAAICDFYRGDYESGISI